jgi:hypothetical protein
MSCLGVHFALTEEDVAALRAIADEQERLSFLQEDIEERYLAKPATYAAESDKSWDAMHRVLSDGQLTWNGGTYPLNHAVLAGELLYTDSDYIMTLKSPDQVRDIAGGVRSMTEAQFRVRYDAIDRGSYGSELSDEDFNYTWQWFQGVRELYERAANEGDLCSSQQISESYNRELGGTMARSSSDDQER